jgi:predicted GIY-YIG superfamily endonuclease
MASIPSYAKGVYLIHFDTPLAHARHYLGYADDISRRVATHKRGQGARILQVCIERGITFQLVRTWRGRNRAWERRLKNRKNAKILCPVCNPFSAEQYPTNRRRNSSEQCPF